LAVTQNVANQERLSGILFAYDDNHGGLARINFASVTDVLDVELFDLEVHVNLSREVFDFGLTRFYNMTKKKPDLRAGPIAMSAHHYGNLKALRSGSETYWNTANLQPFFPPIERLFKTTTLENASEYGIRFPNEVSAIMGENTIKTSQGEVLEIHRKNSMVLSPFKWMQGDYGKVLGLPNSSEESLLVHRKLQNPDNSAYVGAIISAALSHSGCRHFPKVYGVFTGMSRAHTIDISDDYADLCERSWFSTNIGKTFEIKLSDSVNKVSDFNHTRGARPSLLLSEDEVDLGNVETLEGIPASDEMATMNQVFKEEAETDDDSSDNSSVSTSYIFAVESCDCESFGDEEEEEEEEEEPFAWATFTNVPVQTTVMERCEGTLYKLCSLTPEPEKHLAWVAQTMFALAFAQCHFAFTHNDLHSNNVMYIPTAEEFLYYTCEGALYRVPTFGYLIKIIDFERGTASVKLAGMKEAKLFMSDHFLSDEEAGGQYNFGMCYNSKYKEIKPNASFDLVRLATSMFWDLFPDGPDGDYADNLLFKLFVKWLTLEDGTSVLFGKTEPRHDRFHGFDLYKAIARYCKDTAVPRKEIVSLKPKYEISKIPLGASVCSVDF
jgi:hypothetical protein